MDFLSTTIKDLSIIIVTAGLFLIFFKLIKFPSIIGYLISGIFLGPYILNHPLIYNPKIIYDFSELGVAFLMFYIGLEFDINKLKRFMGASLLSVILQTSLMIFIGVLSAPLMGWSSINGLFLGCLLAISSTMITVPIINDLGAKGSSFAQLAIGILVLEDIIAILVSVILSGLSIDGYFDLNSVIQVIFLIGVFIVMIYFIGQLLTYFLLKWLHHYGNNEIITVISVSILLGVGQLAHKFNFSIALGSFLAGAILSKSTLAKDIEKVIDPMKDLFTAIFFVTIGMQINPHLLKNYLLSIVLLTIAVFLGKLVTTWMGLFLSGEKSKIGFQAGVCKAQIGEFSFVIATLGQKKNLTEPGMMAIAVGVALGTILIVSQVSLYSNTIYNRLSNKCPKFLIDFNIFYENFIKRVKEELKKRHILSAIQMKMLEIIGYFFIFNGILIITFLSFNFLSKHKDLFNYLKYLILIFSSLLCVPFVISIIRNLKSILLLITNSAFSIKANNLLNKGNLRQIIDFGLLCLVLILCGGLYLSIASPFLPRGFGLFLFCGLIIVIGFILFNYIIKINSKMEIFFMKRFNYELKTEQALKQEMLFKEINKKNFWPLKIKEYIIKKYTIACGKKIKDLNLITNYGVFIVGISREKYIINNPSSNIYVFPKDHLFLLGNENSILNAKLFLSQIDNNNVNFDPKIDLKLEQIYIPPTSSLVGGTLSDYNIKKTYGIHVVGIQRGNDQIYNPSNIEVIQAYDVLIIVGKVNFIKMFYEFING